MSSSETDRRDNQHGGNGPYTFKQLTRQIQASDAQIRDNLRELGAIEIEGTWRYAIFFSVLLKEEGGWDREGMEGGMEGSRDGWLEGVCLTLGHGRKVDAVLRIETRTIGISRIT